MSWAYRGYGRPPLGGFLRTSGSPADGEGQSLSEKAIRSHYKRLSLKFHPDKIRPDPAKNQTAESLNNHFVELTKAYKALTDEEVRNNYIQYGHPDGKQSMSIGIALPKFMITEGNGKYVLLVYGLLLGVLLPYVVGRWWYGTQRVTKEKVLVASAGKLFREYDEAMSEAKAVGALSVGDEFGEVLRSEQAEEGIATIEKRILAEQSGAGPLLTDKDRVLLAGLDGGVRRKVLGLLWAYLGRVDLGDATLNAGMPLCPDGRFQKSSLLTDMTREIRSRAHRVRAQRISSGHLSCV